MSQFRTKLFPNCVVPSATVGDGTLYEPGVTLDQAMEWYWRVKKWELVADTISGVKTFSDIEFPPANFGGATERDLICPQTGGAERKAEDHLFIEWEMWFYSVQVDSAGSPSANPGNLATDMLRSDSGLYYPQFLFIATSDSGGDLSSWGGDTGTYPLATITLNLDGFTIPLYSSDETPFISLDFHPQEWWPYAPTSGGLDIFDTATGAQLNPLVVID